MSQRSQSVLTIYTYPLQDQNQTNAILKIKEMVCFSYLKFPYSFSGPKKIRTFIQFSDSPVREYVPTIAPVIPSASLSRCSAPPLIPEEAVGRVVLFGHTWSRSRTTKNVTPAMLYSEHVRKERKAYKAYNKKVLKAAALGKKANLREVQPVKLFSQLTAAERLVFEQRAAKEIPYG